MTVNIVIVIVVNLTATMAKLQIRNRKSQATPAKKPICRKYEITKAAISPMVRLEHDPNLACCCLFLSLLFAFVLIVVSLLFDCWLFVVCCLLLFVVCSLLLFVVCLFFVVCLLVCKKRRSIRIMTSHIHTSFNHNLCLIFVNVTTTYPVSLLCTIDC